MDGRRLLAGVCSVVFFGGVVGLGLLLIAASVPEEEYSPRPSTLALVVILLLVLAFMNAGVAAARYVRVPTPEGARRALISALVAVVPLLFLGVILAAQS